MTPEPEYTWADADAAATFLRPAQPGVAVVVTVLLTEIAAFSALRIYLQKDLRPADNRATSMQVAVFTCHTDPIFLIFIIHMASNSAFATG